MRISPISRAAICRRSPSAFRQARGSSSLPKSGEYGGTLSMLFGSAKDVRMIVVFGYARLVCYTPDFEIVPDILESFEVEEDRIFTLHLRPDHRWSDGEPFTTEDFRYWWDDVANNEELAPTGPPVNMLVDGEPPQIEIVDETHDPLHLGEGQSGFPAGARRLQVPLYIFRPAHYLKKFHTDYVEAERWRDGAENPASRTGRRCTTARTICTATTIRACRHSSPGCSRPSRRRNASCSSATPIITASNGGPSAALYRPDRRPVD